jgi:endonuclease YncB( thermonuclease family)
MRPHHRRTSLRAALALLAAFTAAASIIGVSLRSEGVQAAAGPLWVNDLQYGSKGGGFHWDPVSNQVWTGERGWHVFAPQPSRTVTPLWVNDLGYGSKGGGFYLDPPSGQVWTSERGWHFYDPRPAPTPAIPTPTRTPTGQPSGLIQCTVSSVTDGDTINVTGCSDAGPVRLLLIDAPESGSDCYAAESTAYLNSRLRGLTVGLEGDGADMDHYGRRLRYVWLDGELVNATTVRLGYARAAVFEGAKHELRIRVSEEFARHYDKAGLWAVCGTGACSGAIRITALDKAGEVVTLTGVGDIGGYRLVSKRGAATQRYTFRPNLRIDGTIQVVSGVPFFPDTANRVWWSSDSIWNNNEDDDAQLFNGAGILLCEFNDGHDHGTVTQTATTSSSPPQKTPTPTPTRTPTKTATVAPTTPGGNCHSSYPTVCIPPPPPDLDCGEIPYSFFQVIGSDPHNFDGDNDGVGCEA